MIHFRFGGLEFDRSTYHYKSRRHEQAGLEARIKEICQTRVRYGYRRVHVLLRREGWEINMKKTHRIYTSLGRQLRSKTPKRRVKAKLRDDLRAASTSNEIWALDLVHDQLATGQKIRVLTVVDTFRRVLARHRSEVQLSGRRRGCDPRTDPSCHGLSEDDPDRSGIRVRQPGP